MRLLSNIGAAILFIIALIAIVLGFLFALGSSSPQGSDSWLVTGVFIIGFGILCVIGAIVLIYVSRRKAKQEAAEAAQSMTVNVDLPGQMKIESMKCQSCGGELTSDNIKLVAGAPVVSCPFCGSTHQMSEEPKW